MQGISCYRVPTDQPLLVAAVYMMVPGCVNLAAAHQACTLKLLAWIKSHCGVSKSSHPTCAAPPGGAQHG